MGRAAGARRPSPRDLRSPSTAARELLRATTNRGAHLANDQRRRGAGHARDRQRRDPLPGRTDADRHARDPPELRPAPGADHFHNAAADRRCLAGLPHRLRRCLPAHTRDDRTDHRLSAGVALRRARRSHVRPGAPARGRVRRAQRAQPRREHDDSQHERRLLSGDRVRLSGGHGGRPALRWRPGAPWCDRARGLGRLPRGPEQLLRSNHAAIAALHDLPVGHGGARQDLRAAGRAAGDARANRRGDARADPWRAALRTRQLRLSQA